ncbi:MAG TPA: inorganic diphosphatase [Acidobacteriota bacterium]
MATKSVFELPPFDEESGNLNVIVDTPQGSRNKFKYDPELKCFKLSHVMAEGLVFPFDFGFIPSTQGGDGDPLDALLLIEEPAFSGCLIKSRLIGVITADQTVEGKTERNDRFLAVAAESPRYKNVQDLKDLESLLLKQIEHFFVSYNEIRNRKFKVKRRLGAKQAKKILLTQSNSKEKENEERQSK